VSSTWTWASHASQRIRTARFLILADSSAESPSGKFGWTAVFTWTSATFVPLIASQAPSRIEQRTATTKKSDPKTTAMQRCLKNPVSAAVTTGFEDS